MLEMHRAVQEEARAITEQWKQYINDASERSVQAIRGSLMPFLTTPLQSDVGEIRRHITDQVRSVVKAVVPHSSLGPVLSSEGRFDVEPLKTGPLKLLTAAGKRHLGELGFKFTKASPPVFESTFLVEGGVNLDILEHIVRDRMGIYASLHGKHIVEAACMTFAAHNLTYRRGEGAEQKGMEAVIFVEKGPQKYEAFRQGLAAVLDGVLEEKKALLVTVWQRKLGLGRGLEYQIRIRANGRAAATECVDRLLRMEVGGMIQESLRKGRLLYKEILGTIIGA
jgi:hypothetical protein